jgi:protein gp37
VSPSSIEWTDETWNPTLGCSVASPGCDNCYAARVAMRGMTEAHKGLAEMVDGVPRFNGTVRMLEGRLNAPLNWKKPRRVFVDSMSDLFHSEVPFDFIHRVWEVMEATPQHTYQILTKRPQRLPWALGYMERPILPNVWLGTSIESDRYAFRADHLRSAPATVRFISAEPLLSSLPSLDLTGIDWLICGGESGPRARPMHPEWVRELRDRCVESGTKFFFKQWGSWGSREDCPPVAATGVWLAYDSQVSTHVLGNPSRDRERAMFPMDTKLAGRRLDGRTWDEMPERVA